MLPTINGKSLLDCEEEDLQVLVENPDYRENEYLDYKVAFSINDYPKEKKVERQKAIAEFRSDVCALANANGGYLIFGVKEDGKGIPEEITGINIADGNTDKFELNLKNWLQPISPRMPNIEEKFILLSNGYYVVIILVHHDFFAPYIHLENEKDYRIYKRIGNSKAVIAYSELKNMFTQTLSLEKEVEKFRRERIDYFRMQKDNDEYLKFWLLHFIPETFMDSSYNKSVFVLERTGADFSSIFQQFEYSNRPCPMIEGLRYTGENSGYECRLYNSGIAEFFLPLRYYLDVGQSEYSNGFFPWDFFWGNMEKTLSLYINKIKKYIDAQRIYVGISIIGCKNVMTEKGHGIFRDSTIDRDNFICAPVVFDNIQDDNIVNTDMRRLRLEYLLSLGIRFDKKLNELIKEIYE